MTATLPVPASEAYQISEPLIGGAPLPAVHTPRPNEVAREELLLKKLGSRGWGRMHHFRNFYEPGWGEPQCKPLSPRATEAFFRFLEAVKFPTNCVPSLFLTDQGGLELRWEHQGDDLQIEFSSEGLEFYSAAEEREGFLPHSEVGNLAARLSSR